MIGRIEYIRDVTGNQYLGINIYKDTVNTYLNKLEDILEDKYEAYVKCQQNRDRGHHHITVMNPMEYKELSNNIGMDKFVNSLEPIFKEEFNINLLGVGTAEKNGNRTYFVVANSPELQEVRKRYNLPHQDFHITIGFLHRDVFGVRKNEVIKDTEPFLKLFKKLYYNENESLNFIWEVENFDGDIDSEIEPIQLNNTNFTFRNGDMKYYTLSLLDDKLSIVCKWEDNEKKPILSNTLIAKKLKSI